MIAMIVPIVVALVFGVLASMQRTGAPGVREILLFAAMGMLVLGVLVVLVLARR
jgi:hypothetical protein